VASIVEKLVGIVALLTQKERLAELHAQPGGMIDPR